LVIVEIADTGIGIAPQDLPAIFTPFFRADITRPTHSGGMGLGLAIAKRVVDLHGGTIMAESVLGQGSTFRIHMPITRAKS
jgi:signal transduction histidine kinase